MKMFKLFMFFVVAIISTGCVTTSKAPIYQKGQIFSGSILVGTSNITVPLPEGEWTLIGFWQETGNTNNQFVLAQVENNELVKAVNVYSPNDRTNWGYPSDNFCRSKDIIFIDVKSNVDRRKQDCWGINHWRMTLNDDDDKVWFQAMDYFKENKITVPITMLVTTYRKADRNKYVIASYAFNPEAEGFSPPKYADWSSNDWHKDRYYSDPEKVTYIDKMKSWGAAWDKRVSDGFAGL